MTIITVKTNAVETKRILNNEQRFLLRAGNYNIGDVIQIAQVVGGKYVPSPITDKKYVVTVVLNHASAPIERGVELIGFREL